MCGRYYIAEDEQCEEMSRIVELINRKKTPEGLKTAGEIFPSDVVPVLANSRKNDVQPFAMRWGYSFPNGRPIINARSETAASKPLFKDGMKQRRCLIPASHYYEWERRDGQKIKYALRPANSQMMYLAGIYHLEKHEEIVIPAFAVLTRAAVPQIAFIHERMPVILSANMASQWLDSQNNAEEVIQSAISELEYHPAESR